MLVIPAIDLRSGSCVRLECGDFDRQTKYRDDPVAVANEFVAAGAKRIHIVDLDATLAGEPQHTELIGTIATEVSAQGATIQVGGGLRNLKAINDALVAGAAQVIIGSAAISNPALLMEACKAFPQQIIVGLDSRSGKVATEGWQKTSDISPKLLTETVVKAGCAGIIHTDIERDGMLNGVNTDSLDQIIKVANNCPVFASGGFSNLAEFAKLASLGAAGVVIGKAIYNGSIELSAAIAQAGTQS